MCECGKYESRIKKLKENGQFHWFCFRTKSCRCKRPKLELNNQIILYSLLDTCQLINLYLWQIENVKHFASKRQKNVLQDSFSITEAFWDEEANKSTSCQVQRKIGSHLQNRCSVSPAVSVDEAFSCVQDDPGEEIAPASPPFSSFANRDLGMGDCAFL